DYSNQYPDKDAYEYSDLHGHEYSNPYANEDGHQHSDGYVDEYPDADGHGHSHSDGYADEYPDRHADADGHGHSHSDGYADEYPDVDADGHADSHSDRYADEYPERHADADGHADSHPDGYADRDTHGDTDRYADRHSDADSDTDPPGRAIGIDGGTGPPRRHRSGVDRQFRQRDGLSDRAMRGRRMLRLCRDRPGWCEYDRVLRRPLAAPDDVHLPRPRSQRRGQLGVLELGDRDDRTGVMIPRLRRAGSHGRRPGQPWPPDGLTTRVVAIRPAAGRRVVGGVTAI
ncbi:MAG: MSCRAMM family adhesin SdrC, partial [Actinobacteria bacterium]|nr:MSCRAMM family adhesin SdrC [Actinomycetota bacterium]